MKFLVCSIFWLTINSLSAQVSPADLFMKQGDHAVGFKHFIIVDSSRTYQNIYDWTNEVTFRTIPVSIWYPGVKDSELDKLQLIDYLNVMKEEDGWEHLPNQQILTWFFENTADNRNKLPEEMMAYQELPMVDAKFPLIVYAPSYQASSVENYALCEYLASYGYIVIASPSQGAQNKMLEGGTFRDMEAQSRDLEMLIGYSHRLKAIDTDEIYTMGFSFGGLSNVYAQMRNKKIKGTICLDGSIKYNYELINQIPYLEDFTFDKPFIHLAQKEIPAAVLEADNIDPALNHDFKFLDLLDNCFALSLQYKDLSHSQFSSLGVLFWPRDPRQDRSDEKIINSYRLMCTHVKQLLDHFTQPKLSHEDFVKTILLPSEDQAYADVIELKLPREQPKLTFNDFNELAQQHDYEQLDTIYQLMQKEETSFTLQEWKLNNLGLQLVFNKSKYVSGIAVFEFATRLFPNSANLFDSLAESYKFGGDIPNAIKYYRESLRLDPSNTNATNNLEILEKE